MNNLKQELTSILERHPYRFAKSMPYMPHWYTLRKEWDSDLFSKTVIQQRELGYDKVWGGRSYRYFNANGYQYWTMGASVETTILINRAKIKYSTLYDDIATSYDSWYETPECYKENLTIFQSLELENSSKILDVGCGTGLLLDHIALLPLIEKMDIQYNGIDPSQEMLGVLSNKHPHYSENTMCSKFEDFYSSKDFTHIVSLFGSPSYIKKESLNKLYDLSVAKKFFYMFYKKGYLPKYEEHLNIEVLKENDIVDLADDLDAETYHWNQFLIVKSL